jgi:hypothetical protein
MINAPRRGKVPMIADGGPDIPDMLPGGSLIIGSRSGIPGIASLGSDDQHGWRLGSATGSGISGTGGGLRGRPGADRVRYAPYLMASGSWS